METRRTAVALAALSLLSLGACGGGGGDSGKGTRISISLDPKSVLAAGSYGDPAPTSELMLIVTNFPESGLYVGYESTGNGIASVDFSAISQTAVRVVVVYREPFELPVGTHSDTVKVRVCEDDQCAREVRGSPATFTSSYTVSNPTQAEPGLTAVPYLTRISLAHDVIDAEYSAALEAIVMVSSAPRNSLYLYDVVTATERELALARAPTAVSVSPDGLSAAVGHDALITYVNLATLGQPGAPAPIVLNVSTNVFDIVLDGRGNVHALPAADQWVQVHSVKIATNVETLGGGSLRAGTHGRLHPTGDYMYTADNGLSPSDIAKYDLRSGVGNAMYDSPYHGDYEMCGDVWVKQDGATLYTKCGNTFGSSENRSQDMIYSGRLQLSARFVIRSLSQSDATKEIMLVEEDRLECSDFAGGFRCYTHLALYESDFLNRTALYSIPPIEVGGAAYAQRGLFAFHSADGLHRYMISRLQVMPGVAQPFYLTVLQ